MDPMTVLDDRQYFSLKRSRRAARKGLAKVLLGNGSGAWIFSTILITIPSFILFSNFGKLTHLPEIRSENRWAALFFGLAFAISNLGFGTYERESRLRFGTFFQRSLFSLFVAATLASLSMYFFFFVRVGRYSMIYGSFGSFFVFVLLLGLMHRWLRRYAYHFIILGPESRLTQILKSWDHKTKILEKQNLQVSKFETTEFPAFQDSPELFDHYLAFFRQNSLCDLVLSDVFDSKDVNLSRATMAALQSGIRVVPASEFYAEFSYRYPVEMLPVSWAIHAGFDVNHPVRTMIKRMFDIVLSLALLMILSPVLLVISFLIALTAGFPIFFIQERRGRFSRNFSMIKFRTMTVGEEGPETTSENDVRVTFMGKILRPLHLDELPQLWNILKGDMSIVGPRPESRNIADVARSYSALYELRHMVRPGLSGLAQILQGKTGDSPEVLLEKLSYDLYYIRNHSLLLDFWIMFRTLFVLAKRAW